MVVWLMKCVYVFSSRCLDIDFNFHAINTLPYFISRQLFVMGSEGPPAVTIHVTGFKKFHGVSENPTETIVSNLREYMKKKGMPKGLILGSCNILETAGHGAVAPLYQTLQSAISEKDSESANSRRIIWVSCQLITCIMSYWWTIAFNFSCFWIYVPGFIS